MLALGLVAAMAPSADPGTPGRDGDTVEASGADPVADREEAALGDPIPADTVLTNAPGAILETNRFRPIKAPQWFTYPDGTTLVISNSGPAVVSPPIVRLETRAEITPEGVVLEGGSFRVLAEGNLNHSQAVRIYEPGSDGKSSLDLHVTALALSDPRTGKRVWLGTLRDSQGIVLSGQPVRILWTNAFNNIMADVMIQYNVNTILQEVYLREPLNLPEDPEYNSAQLRLEVWSEVFAGAEPAKTLRTISLAAPGDGQDDPVPRADKQAADVELDWGSSRMIQGGAFRVNAGVDRASPERWRVAKQWIQSEQRRFLVESVDLETMKPALDSLRSASLSPHGAATPPGSGTPLLASASAGSAAGAPVRPAALDSLPPVIPSASASGRARSAASRAALPGRSVPTAFSL